MRVGLPFLYIGPPESHITDILAGMNRNGVSYFAKHGDISQASRYILDGVCDSMRTNPHENRDLAASFSRDKLLPQLIKAIGSLPMVT